MDQGGRGPAGVEGPLGKPGLPGLGKHMVLILDGNSEHICTLEGK